MELTYIVKSADESIKQILKNEFNMSDRFILKLKNHKSIFINNVSVFINFKIHSGDVLKIIENFKEDSSNIVSNSDINLNILYEDEEVIVCEKPTGVAAQTRRLGQADMESLLKNYRAGKGEQPYIGVVHRLDQPVRGVMVFAKTKEAAADLSRQVQTRMADKFYYAVTDGVPEQKKGTLEDYLLRDGKTNTSKVVSKSTEGAKSARLDYEVTAQNKTNAILRIQLDTGRHHQIRVQLANAGIPIVGDAKYNFKETMTRSGKGLLLCSYKIGFKHPKTHKKMEFEIRNPFLI